MYFARNCFTDTRLVPEVGIIVGHVFWLSPSTGIIHRYKKLRHFLPRIIFDTTVNLEVNKGLRLLNNILALAAAESFRGRRIFASIAAYSSLNSAPTSFSFCSLSFLPRTSFHFRYLAFESLSYKN